MSKLINTGTVYAICYDIPLLSCREPSDPVAYAVIGGGEWGPRAVARALLDSLYVAWERDTVLLDMEEAVRLHRSSGLEEVNFDF